MALRNAFQRSSSLLSIRSRAPMLPRALGHRYIHASSAQRFTVQSDWKLGPLFGVLALLGGLETCYVIGKNDLTRKKKAVTQANGIFAKESHILVNDKPELTKKNEAVMQTNDVSPEAIQYALDQAKGQPFLKDNEEKMAYFKQQISQCHALCRDESKRTEAAICLHRGLRVYRSMENPGLIITHGEPIPAHVGEIFEKMNALDVETQFEEKNAIFNEQISQGEALCQDESKREEAAACFYRALKVFPEVEDQISDLSDLTRTTIPKPVVDIALKMMARDPERNSRNQFPTDIEEKEAYFFQEVLRGEALSKDKHLDESKKIEAAMCFYNALNVHPSPGYLLDVYQKTVPQPVLDALHERIAINTATATERIPYSTEIGEEAYFSKLGEEEACLMKEFSRGQDLCQNEDQDEKTRTEAAMCFYRALKAHPSPADLIDVYDENVPKPVLDILGRILGPDLEVQERMIKGKADRLIQEVSQGARLCRDDSKRIEAAECFYRALNICDSPDKQIEVFKTHFPKPVIDILLEMVARDPRVKARISRSERANNGLQEVSQGQILCLDESKNVEAAECFCRALKMSDFPKEQMKIFKDLSPKPVIDSLVQMIALDPDLNTRVFSEGPDRPDSKP